MIHERKDDVWVVEFSGQDLEKLDKLVAARGTNRLQVLVHALNLCGAELQSSTAAIQPSPITFHT